MNYCLLQIVVSNQESEVLRLLKNDCWGGKHRSSLVNRSGGLSQLEDKTDRAFPFSFSLPHLLSFGAFSSWGTACLRLALKLAC